jgi:hypothetical protein
MDLIPFPQQISLILQNDSFGFSRNLSLHVPHFLNLNWIESDLRFTAALKDMDMSRLVIVERITMSNPSSRRTVGTGRS